MVRSRRLQVVTYFAQTSVMIFFLIHYSLFIIHYYCDDDDDSLYNKDEMKMLFFCRD